MRPTPLRKILVETALRWQDRYGVAPAITSALSEVDAARLVGVPAVAYCRQMRDRTAVSRGCDFTWRDKRYQVKANRPSGKPGSTVTLVPKPKNYDWDFLVWILYNQDYSIAGAWIWPRAKFRARFEHVKRLSPEHYSRGRPLV